MILNIVEKVLRGGSSEWDEVGGEEKWECSHVEEVIEGQMSGQVDGIEFGSLSSGWIVMLEIYELWHNFNERRLDR